MEKYGKIWKNGRFSGRLRPDWGHTAWAATAGLGSKGLKSGLSEIRIVSHFSLSLFISIVYRIIGKYVSFNLQPSLGCRTTYSEYKDPKVLFLQWDHWEERM